MFDSSALKAKYNPEGSKLRHDQLELLSMLRVVRDICQQHNIRWWLSSGTLLGAARHKGFIPWDDDLDIVMLRSDFKRFVKLMRNYQNEEFVFHSMDNDIEYIKVYGKFRKRQGCVEGANRRCNYLKWRGVFIDIFSIERTNRFAARASSIVYNNLQHITSYIKCKWLRRPLIFVINALCFGIIIPLLRLIGLINLKGEYHYTLGSGWGRHTFFMKDTMPLTTIEFEGEQFPAPCNVDAYLTRVYGNWRELPTDDDIKRSIHCPDYIEEIYGTAK